jgi:hypothetical protein
VPVREPRPMDSPTPAPTAPTPYWGPPANGEATPDRGLTPNRPPSTTPPDPALTPPLSPVRRG